MKVSNGTHRSHVVHNNVVNPGQRSELIRRCPGRHSFKRKLEISLRLRLHIVVPWTRRSGGIELCYHVKLKTCLDIVFFYQTQKQSRNFSRDTLSIKVPTGARIAVWFSQVELRLDRDLKHSQDPLATHACPAEKVGSLSKGASSNLVGGSATIPGRTYTQLQSIHDLSLKVI